MDEFKSLVKIIGRWTITAEFEYSDRSENIAASEVSMIKPLVLPDGTIDQLALDEYEDFIVNLLGVFDRCDFEVIEERESPFSFSHYFDLVKSDDITNKDYKYILYIRVSDHELEKGRLSVQREWYADHAETQKQPATKSKQKWKLKRLTVNKDTYFSYDEALDDIEHRLESMK